MQDWRVTTLDRLTDAVRDQTQNGSRP